MDTSKFHSYSTCLPNVTVRFISQHKSIGNIMKYIAYTMRSILWSQYTIPSQALELYKLSWLNPFSKAFVNIYYFPKFHCYVLGPLKVTGCSIFYYFLTNSHCNIFWTKSAAGYFPKLVWKYLIITKFPKRHICNAFCIEINTRCLLLSTIKDWRISKSDETILYLKERMMVNGKSFQL